MRTLTAGWTVDFSSDPATELGKELVRLDQQQVFARVQPLGSSQEGAQCAEHRPLCRCCLAWQTAGEAAATL